MLTLELRMEVNASHPRDEVRIDGNPPLDLVLDGGVGGDRATTAILVNLIPSVLRAEPGLRTVLDLVVPRILS